MLSSLVPMLEEPSGKCQHRAEKTTAYIWVFIRIAIHLVLSPLILITYTFSLASATALADRLNLDFALINRKRRRDLTASMIVPTVPPTPAVSEAGSHSSDDTDHADDKMELLVGDVKGRVAILIDDMVDTGHTVRLAAGVLKDCGAKQVYALISHGVFTSRLKCDHKRGLIRLYAGLLSDTSMENLKDLPVEKLVVTNSIDQTDRVAACDGLLEVIDIAPVIAESIRRTHNG
jgi:ribose-phosphate pyrophosphokinase